MEKNQKSVIIIGAGMAGLCAGNYLKQNGYKTTIFESHYLPGGLCTSWRRGDITFDGCIHWLPGSAKFSKLHNYWSEVVNMNHFTFIDHDYHQIIEDESGNQVTFFCDKDRLKIEFLRVSPEDKNIINAFISAIEVCIKADLVLPINKSNFFTDKLFLIKNFKLLNVLADWSMSARNFSKKFKHPLLQKAILSFYYPDCSLVFILLTLAWLHKKNAGYPVGGSLNFAQKIANQYLADGGEIRYRTKVASILTRENRAIGVTVNNGDSFYADYIISAADAHSTLFRLLNGNFLDNYWQNLFKNSLLYPSLILLSITVNRSMNTEPHHLKLFLTKSIQVDPMTQINDIYINIYNYDPALAPMGTTVISLMIPTLNFTFWNDLRKHDRIQYKNEKNLLAEKIIEVLDKKFGNVKNLVSVVDVATPATIKRYTNNWQGSFAGWQLTPQENKSVYLKKNNLDKLENFYMTGQWVEIGGGLFHCLLSSRSVAETLCKKDKKKFKTRNLTT